MSGAANPVRPLDAAQERHLLRMWRDGVPIGKILGALDADHEMVWRRLHQLLAEAAGPVTVMNPDAGPIDRALGVLDGIARRAPKTPGGFTIKGSPATAVQVIGAANARLIALGLAEIAYPCKWQWGRGV